MKYSINLNQLALSKTKLDIKDGAILEYLKSFCMVDDKKVKELTVREGGMDYRYTWINFNYLILEMPLIKIKGKASISERINKIEKEGFIKTFRAPDRSLYVRLMPKIKNLEFEGKGVRQTEQQVFGKPNSTIRTIDNNKRRGSSFSKKKLKPWYGEEEMRFSKGKWWVLPVDGSEWLEFAGEIKDIKWK